MFETLFTYSRDAKRGKLQIEFGLLCDREGCPVAVEVFYGNTAEPIAQATRRAKRRLTGRDQIGLRVGKVLGRHKMAKHFELDIADASFGHLVARHAHGAVPTLDQPA